MSKKDIKTSIIGLVSLIRMNEISPQEEARIIKVVDDLTCEIITGVV